jgi:corrinoid protein of di/trimethylamine methyltransferase
MREKLETAILDGDSAAVHRYTRLLLEQGKPPKEILDQDLIPAIQRAGDLWDEGELFIPELMQAGNALKEGLSLLRPLLEANAETDSQGCIVIGTIEGDIHDIGKTLVAGMLEAAGHIVIDLGADVSAERFIGEATKHNAEVICVSALLTTTMLNQRKVVNARDEAGLTEKVAVMVGGAPVSRAWADRIGAEGYAPDAFRAVEEASRLMAQLK